MRGRCFRTLWVPLERYGAALVAVAALAFGVVCHKPAAAQSSRPHDNPLFRNVQQDLPMLLEADQLIYDTGNDRVSAVGHVQIYYDDYILEAGRVIYDRRGKRLVAYDRAKFTDPDGYTLKADRIELDDTFRDGFISYVLLETPKNTRLAAQTAVRRGGRYTVLRKGVYTACKACAQNPQKAPLWQIKAEEVVHDQQEETVYYRNGVFELFGVPLLTLPTFQHPAPGVRRKSGFLAPRASSDKRRGYGLAVPYFWALQPHYDLTITPHVFTRQGFLGEVEWRHRTHAGRYFVNVNGLYQLNPQKFAPRPGGNRKWRGSVFSEGDFSLDDDWGWGWALYAPSDVRYFADYEITKKDATEARSTLYLKGARNRNAFEARASYYRITRDDPLDLQDEQAIVHPVMDYHYIFGRPVFGGELGFDVNLTSLTRRQDDCEVFLFRDKTNFTRPCGHAQAPGDGVAYRRGLKGTATRASLDLHWRKRIISHGGMVLTPFSALRADLSWLSGQDASADLPEYYDASRHFVAALAPSAGLKAEWPFIISHGWGHQIITPVAQIVASTNATRARKTPNNDAQSFVFDDTNLFDRDKFSGFDRRESGVRAHVGLNYKMVFRNGGYFDALFGQAYHLGGDNAFAGPELVNVGTASGLQTRRSDFVARAYYQPNTALQLGVRGRFDRDDFSPRRIEALANLRFDPIDLDIGYAYLDRQPALGIHDRRQQINLGGAVRITDNWSVFGALDYSIAQNEFLDHTIGLRYQDECAMFSIEYTQSRHIYNGLSTEKSIMARFALRTLGEGKASQSLQ